MLRPLIIKRNLNQFKTLILGGGAGGMALSRKLAKHYQAKFYIGLVEPNDDHFYQPMWTLVGGGLKPYEASVRKNMGLMSNDVYWMQNIAVKIKPDQNMVELIDGTEIEYQNLVVSVGIDVKFDAIPGLNQAIAEVFPGVCSNYSAFTVEKTWHEIQILARKAKKLGPNDPKLVALFTQPSGQIKCPGAPQKIVYLAEAYFRQQKVRDKIDIIFHTGAPGLLAQPDYAASLRQQMDEKNVTVVYQNELTSLDYKNFTATFKETGEIKYDMIHVVPPHGPSEVCRDSKLADANGFIDVDKHTLQHTRYRQK